MPPRIELTAAAAAALRAATAGLGEAGRIRVIVDERWEHGLDVGPPAPGDLEVPAGELTLLCPAALADRLDGIVIDHVEGPDGGGFRIDNPNAPPAPRPIAAGELARRLAAGEALLLLDVRTPAEVAGGRIEGARRIDLDDLGELLALDRGTPMVLYADHDERARAAAAYLSGRGFRAVHVLVGGIDAWTAEAGPGAPRP